MNAKDKEPHNPSETRVSSERWADPDALAKAVQCGDIRAAARLVTLAERNSPVAAEALRLLQPHTGRAHTVGITGVPGSGKSTLVDQLVETVRAAGLRVGVLAVDPSSPFTHGAILGDRIRMQRHSTDPGTFIRSLASRGDMGGLSAATWDAVRILDASGMDVIFVETVGAGQLETDIVSSAHTVVVATVPGLGDHMQAAKGGLMEIADIFVVNMADRPDADQAVINLQDMLRFQPNSPAWEVPVMTTVANAGKGIDGLWQAIRRHRTHLQEAGDPADRQLEQVQAELLRALERLWNDHMRKRLDETGNLRRVAEEVLSGCLDAHAAVARLWRELQASE